MLFNTARLWMLINGFSLCVGYERILVRKKKHSIKLKYV